MFALRSPEPEWVTLIPARDDAPAVRVLFAPVSPKSIRQARQAVADILRVSVDAIDDAGDAFTGALVRVGIRDWDGIGDEQGEPNKPTPDVEIRDPITNEVTGVELGTISAFLAEPRLFEAADREYVLPWAKRDAEKNGSSPSLNGISARETQAPDTADTSATPPKTAAAKPTLNWEPKRARTASTSSTAKKAKPSGK